MFIVYADELPLMQGALFTNIIISQIGECHGYLNSIALNLSTTMLKYL